MALKRLFSGTDNRIKRRVSAVMTAVILLTTVGSVTYLKTRKVEAKETLYSIEKVLSDLESSKSSYDILEIVPDMVSGNVTVKNISGNSVDVAIIQNMGFLGYYVGGSEPVRKDVDHVVNDALTTSVNGQVYKTTLNESTLRYGVVNEIYNAIRQSNDYDEKDGPFSLARGYAEVRSGEDFENVSWIGSEEQFKKYLADNTLVPINRSQNSSSAEDRGWIDTAKGFMVSENYVTGYANYIGKYAVTSSENDIAGTFISEFLSENRIDPAIISYEDENFYLDLKHDGSEASYEPNLVLPKESTSAEEMVSANVAAVFDALTDEQGNKLNVKSGYKVVKAESVAEAKTITDMTPVYRWDENRKIYIYAGRYAEVLSNNSATVSGASAEGSNANMNEQQNALADNVEEDTNVVKEELPEESLEGDQSVENTGNELYEEESMNESVKTVKLKPAYSMVSTTFTAETLNSDDELLDSDGLNESLEDEEEPLNNGEKLDDGLIDEDGLNEDSIEESLVDEKNDSSVNISIESVTNYDTEGATDDVYYVVTFEYTELNNTSAVESDKDSGLYHIREFAAADDSNGAQYILADTSNPYGVIVPNLFNTGLISVKEECDQNNFIYEYAKGEGNYKWLGSEEEGKAYHIKGDKIYYRYGIENREWFKRFVFDRDSSKYDKTSVDTAEKLSIKVDVKRASEVTEYDIGSKLNNGEYQYRLIALMAGDCSYCIADDNDFEPHYTGYVSGTDHDISPYVFTQITNRVAKYNTPIIVDYKIISDAGRLSSLQQDSLMYNLAVSLMLESLSGYNSLVYGNEQELISGHVANTIYSPYDYLSYNNVTMIDNNYHHYVNKNVYLYNRKTADDRENHLNVANLLFDVRLSETDEINVGFSEVVLDIENDKKYREADVSLANKPLTHDWVSEATAIRYIIGYGNTRVTDGKGEVKVLEIEPVNCYDLDVNNRNVINDEQFLKKYPKGSDEYNKLLTKDDDGKDAIYEGELYYKDKDEKERTIIKQYGLKINLVKMTTAEYIGHIEDINAEYDLIYIGMNTGGSWTKVRRYVITKPASMEQVSDSGWVTDGNRAGWYNKSWVYKGESDTNYYFEAENDNYFYKGWNSKAGSIWGVKWGDWFHVITYKKVPEQGEWQEYEGINDSYGGYHHRFSTDADVAAKRALSANTIITDFNDDNMDGLVYCNVGDMTYITDTCGGSLKIRTNDSDASPEYRWLETVDGKKDGYGKAWDYISITNDATRGYSRDEQNNLIMKDGDYNYSLYRTRYNGNDITKEKCEDLKDFALAGYPIILADGFYSSYDVSNGKGKINECTVDNSSYMYDAAKWLIEGDQEKNVSPMKNVFKQSYTPANVFNWYLLNLGKPTLEMTDARSRESQTSTVYLNESDKSGDGYYYAYYRFKIHSKGSSSATAKYNVGLYVDINADGKYSPTNEGIFFTDIKDNDEMRTMNRTGMENGMPVYELIPEHEYEARCKLSSSFVGCLPWRLCVYQIGNSHRRNNADGYFAVRNNAEKVDVLQLKADGGNNWDMKADYDNENSLFHRLITDTDYVPFTVSINSKTRSQLINDVSGTTADDYYEYLKQNYDMLVLGYNDMYDSMSGDEGEVIAEAIKKYIDEGYSVLFTHDCTSFVNNKKHEAQRKNSSDRITMLGANWGYQFNTVIRNIVGMDRYDVMKETTHKDKIEKPYKPRSNRKLELDLEAHGFTYHILNHWGYQNTKSIAKDGWKSMYMSFSDDNWWESTNDVSKSRNAHFNNIFEYSNLVGASIGGGQYGSTTYVSQVNKGQITQYPYKLKDNFDVVQTHSQYYQLDFTADDDNDGESDIVVWYCISDIKNSAENCYNVSPRDVRNNYYIYNKGNVTYSGVGHSTVTGEDEMKLFINTMVAAYRTGLHAPDIAIVDSYNENAKTTRNLYVSYDNQIQKIVSANASDPDLAGLNKNSDIDDYVDLYFNADQVSLVQNASAIDHSLYARVFYEDPSSTSSLGYTPDITTGDYYYDTASDKYVKGEYVLENGTYRKARNGERGSYAKIGDNYYECNFRQLREFEETVIDIGKTKVTELPLTVTPDTAGYISQKSGDEVEIMTDEKIAVLDSRNNFTSDSEYSKFTALKDNIKGCAKIQNGVTYKVRIPVTDDNIWGGVLKSGTDLKDLRSVYVLVMDFATYKNNQTSTNSVTDIDSGSGAEGADPSTPESAGKIYKIDMTKWRIDKADISRVEVFDLD